MKSILKDIVLMLCCSYTCIVSINVFIGDIPISTQELRQTFWLCAATRIVMYMILSVNYTKEWIVYVCSMLGMFLSVFGLGTFVFHLIPLEVSSYISITVAILFVYILCCFMIREMDKQAADAINEKLGSRKKITKEDHHGKDH